MFRTVRCATSTPGVVVTVREPDMPFGGCGGEQGASKAHQQKGAKDRSGNTGSIPFPLKDM